MTPEKGSGKDEQLTWQAERIVTDKLIGSPEFKKEVNRVKKELKKITKGIKVRSRKR